MDNLRNRFAILEDWRHKSYVEHKLSDVLVLIFSAVICGICELADMMVFFENKKLLFLERFGIEKYPSKPTLSRILNMLCGEKVADITMNLMRESVSELGEIIAVDGKAIRSTIRKGPPHSALQILTAYCTESGVVLGQRAIDEKTNEIPVFREMLESIDIKGKIITADALHCQRDTCEKILSCEGDYLLGLKGNQQTTFDDVKLFLSDKINHDEIEEYTTKEKNGGRIEERICRKSGNVNWSLGNNEWPGIKSFFSVERRITVRDKRSEETTYYISSRDMTAKECLKTTRSHWLIESMHWMLDVVWDEDRCGIISENGHKTLNIFRKLALLAHKKYLSTQVKKRSVKSNVLAALINDELLCSVIKNL
jgi:predicted transposase YbfD/YdcC